MKKISIVKAAKSDNDEIVALLDYVCDYLAFHENYPKWKKNIYPTREDVENGIREDAFYVAKTGDKIIGTMILKHKPEEGYKQAKWSTESNYEKIYVVYTLAAHPKYWGCCVGKSLLDYAIKLAKDEGCIAVRLDVVQGNYPAINLYKKCGFKYVDTVSLGYEAYGIPWYELYEVPLIT